MKILVTGGAGFIGSHLVDRLVAEGHEVRVVDSLEEQVHRGKKPDYLNGKAKYISGDIRDKSVLEKSLKDVETVFHEASAVGVGQSMYEIERYMDVNALGTARLLECLVSRENSVKRLVVASSMSIYGEGKYSCGECGDVYPGLRADNQLKRRVWEHICPSCKRGLKPVPTHESKPLAPNSIYAISKRDQEEICLVAGRAYGLPVVALRYFNVYGPRQSLSNPYTGVAAIFSSRIKNDNPPLIYEDGLQTRDFVSVHDVVQANILALKGRMDYGAFNVGSGKPVSILGVAETLIKLYNKRFKPNAIGKFRSGDVRHCFADISKIKEAGYAPAVNFEEGMRELVSWGEKTEAVDFTEKAQQELVSRGLVES